MPRIGFTYRHHAPDWPLRVDGRLLDLPARVRALLDFLTSHVLHSPHNRPRT